MEGRFHVFANLSLIRESRLAKRNIRTFVVGVNVQTLASVLSGKFTT